jgi:hypothetical protein
MAVPSSAPCARSIHGRLEDGKTQAMFELFAQLIGAHLDNQDRLDRSESRMDAQTAAELREQFIAVLGQASGR